MSTLTNIVHKKLNPSTKENLSPLVVTTWRDGSPMSDSLCGGLYNKDTEPTSSTFGSYFKWNSAGPYPVSRLTTVSHSNFVKLINDFGTAPTTIVLDRNVPITANLTIPLNISIEFYGNTKFDISAGVTLTITSTINENSRVLFIGSGKAILSGNSQVNTRWFNILGDGVTDEGTKLKEIFEQEPYRYIFVPKNSGASYRILRSYMTFNNKEIEFEMGTTIQGMSGLNEFEYLIGFVLCNNVKIKGNGLLTDNNKSDYTPSTSGSFGTFRIMSCTNFSMYDVNATNSGGDCFYLGTQTFGVPNVNIRFERVTADGCHRNGWSIINVKRLRMLDCVSKNHEGAFPKAGIDFEPNSNTEFLEDIKLTNFVTENNGGNGILIAPIALRDTPGKSIDIVVDNHRDVGSAFSAYVGEQSGYLGGHVIFNNPYWEGGSFGAFLAWNWSSTGPKVVVRDAEIFNSGVIPFYGIEMTMGVYKRFVNGSNTNPIGNVHIIRPRITDTRTTPRAGTNFYFQDGPNGHGPIQNCSLIDPIEISAGQVPLAAARASLVISDKFRVLRRDYTSSLTVNSISLHPLSTNKGATGTVVQTIQDYESNINHQKELIFEVQEAFTYRIQLPAGHTFLGTNITGSLSLESNTIGDILKIRKVQSTKWLVVDIIGSWKSATGFIAGVEDTQTLETAVLTDTSDFNTFTRPGVYTKFALTSATPPNAPSRDAGTLTVFGNSLYLIQRFEVYGSGTIWTRGQLTSTTWNDWYRTSKHFLFDFLQGAITVNANSYLTVDYDTTSQKACVVGQSVLNVAATVNIGGTGALKPLHGVIIADNTVRVFFENPTGSNVVQATSFRVRFEIEDVTPRP